MRFMVKTAPGEVLVKVENSIRWCLLALLALVSLDGALVHAANPTNGLRIEIMSAYNLVVDSNVESPSTYAPRSAYFGARICNDGPGPISNVTAYIGNYSGFGSTNTPGIYPASNPADHPDLTGPLPGGAFSLTHEGGSLGASDAIRYLGVIPAGECIMVYWLVSYPNLDINGNAVHGPSVKPEDDLFLFYDVWASGTRTGAVVEANDSKKVTMRNEISAMANKIQPNSANKVPQEYLDLLNLYVPSWTNVATDGTAGTTISIEGYWYDLGNVGQGFDNNGDLVPDQNAWMQPVGDPSLFDPACFRLVKTVSFIVVKLKSGGEIVLTGEDKLYYENIPPNNGAVGYVQYIYQVLGAGCTAQMSPYQEVASGFDNEKFNGDFGATLGGNLSSGTSRVDLVKDVDLPSTTPGTVLSYTITYTNEGALPLGNPGVGLPVVIQDRIPTGTTYIAGSAAASNVLPSGVVNYTILYSTNFGTSWTGVEPSPATNVTDIQWWLSDPFPTATYGVVRFRVTISNPYLAGPPLVVNTGRLNFGGSGSIVEDDATTILLGSNSLSGRVYIDNGTGGGVYGNGIADGTEAGISNVLLTLYYDVNGDGLANAGDLVFYTTNSVTTNGTYSFTGLPDGRYVVVVNQNDPDIPPGHTPTSPIYLPAALDPTSTNVNPVAATNLNFGFAPILDMVKTGPATVNEGGIATYTITITNRFPGSGTASGSPVTTNLWSTTNNATYNGDTANKQFFTQTNAWVPATPDTNYATTTFVNAQELLGLSGYRLQNFTNQITNVTLRIPVFRSGSFRSGGGGDRIVFRVYTNGAAQGASFFTLTNLASDLTTQVYEYNITTNRSWSTNDFNGTNIVIQVEEIRGTGPSGGGTIGIDQAGFRIQTDLLIGVATSNTTLNPVPLYDYFDADVFSFVSSTPVVSLSDSNGPAPNEGRLFWNNLGPLYPGGSTSITVNLRVKEPTNNTALVTTNTAIITNATFATGVPANNATSRVATAVQPTGTIGDFIWRDLDGDGVQDGGSETGIAGVSVRLTPPAGMDLGNGPGNPVTNVTDSSGLYLFTGLPSNGIYTVTVLTNTLPGGVGTNTYDFDSGTNAPNNTTLVTLTVTSTNGADNFLLADFGYRNLQSQISGSIWNDMNRDGDATPDVGEPYLTNITVRLFNTNGTLIATTTATNGLFNFYGAFSGTYTVQVDNTTGSLGTGTWTQSFDSNGTNTPHTVAVTLPLGGSATADYSYYQTGAFSIGDTVFYDQDGDGVQDAFDEGISNVTVRLYQDINTNGIYDAGTDPVVGTQVTSTNGTYLFTSLASNRYFVIVDPLSPGLPPSYTITADPQGALDGQSFVVITNASNLLQDFGYRPTGTGSIGDTVWRDRNADGVQFGPLETGISNITVTLQVDFNNDGNYITLTSLVTSANGTYLFTNLPDGNYRVLVDTADPDLPEDAYGNDWYATTATSYDVTISGGNSYLAADFGFAPLGAIGDTIFWDANQNGTQDYNEGGITSVTLQIYIDVDTNGIYSPGDILYDTTSTDTNGNYLFSGLAPTSYVVVVVTTGVLDGVELSADPDADGLPCSDPLATGCDSQDGVTLSPGQVFMGSDFGYVPPGGTIGDAVWVDFDNDGVYDPSESGIPFITVSLYSNGTLVATTETDSDGYYLFYGLLNGNYYVIVNTNDVDWPAGLTQTYDPDSITNSIGTNIVVAGGNVTSIGGTACTNCYLDVDFGYRYAGTNVLSGTIGLDDQFNINGVMGSGTSGVDAGEIPFTNITVFAYLWNDDGDSVVEPGEYVLVDSTVTSTNGDYVFNGLPEGDGNDLYIVSMAAPLANLTLTTTIGDTPATVLVNTTNLQGYTTSAYQAMPVAPVTVNVDFAYILGVEYDFGDAPSSYLTTFLNGARHVIPGAADLFLGASIDAEVNGQPSVGADLDDTTFADDEDGVEVIGIWQNGSGGGTVQVQVGSGTGWLVAFVDFDQGGTFVGAQEMIISSSVSSTGGVANDGYYTFDFDIPPGGLSETNSTSLYARFRLFPSEPFLPELSYFGEASNGEVEDYLWIFHSILGTVYVDSDTNSLFSAGDTIKPGVIIRLYDGANNLVASTVTDLGGDYNFYGLPDGDYRIVMVPPNGSTALLDVDGASNTFSVINLTLSGNSTNLQDFLLDTNSSTAALSGTVFDDDGFGVSGDGLFNGGDAAVGGVVIRLYTDINSNGVAEASEYIGLDVTDALGGYSFTNLPDGDYLVVMDTPVNSTSITDVDGNANGSDFIEVTLAGYDVTGQDFLLDNVDIFGRIGDRVWFDSNGNGIQNAGETNGITNVTVYLVNTSGVVIAQTVTDTNGLYQFNGMPADFYLIRFDLSSVTATGNVRVTDAKQGTNDVVDSDGVTGSVGAAVSTSPIFFGAGQTNLNVDLGIAYIVIKTRAAMAEVRGEWSGGQGRVVWQTSSEWGTAGFRVYRVDPETGAEAPLADAMVPSALEANGSTYQLVDPAAASGATATYRLEEVEFSGEVLDLGTFNVIFSAPVKGATRTATPRSAPKKALAPTDTVAGPSDCLKVGFRKEGIYAAAFADIATGLGVTAGEVAALAAAGELAVTSQTNPVPYHVDAANNRIVFFGQALADFYARDNVYMIRRAPGLHMVRRDPAATGGAQVFPVQNRYEVDQYLFDALTVPVDDLFYWDFIVSGNTNTGSRNFPVDLTGYAGGDVALTVRLVGMSITTNTPDHQVEILFNGSLVTSVSINDQESLEAPVTVPAALVLAGTNTVTVRGTRPASSGSFFALDWIDAAFNRTVTPTEGTLVFHAGGSAAVDASLFAAPLALSIADPSAPVLIADETGSLPGGSWSVASTNERFAVIETAAVASLPVKTAVCDAWFLSASNQIDYLIVVASSMRAAAQELADYRSSQGLRVGIAVFEEVCDLFRGGVRTPEAISDLMKYASATWARAPWLVVLAGNGHYDFLGAFSPEANPLPPLLYRSSRGVFSADGLFTDLNGDTAPDIAIGRLPALDAAQLTVMIGKIKAHETEHDAAWQKELTLAADTREAIGAYGSPADFAADSERLASMAAGMNVSRIYRDTLTIANARTQLLARFYAGAGVIHYTGHGNPSIMGRTGSTAILRDTDVNALTNARQPLLISLSCLLGRYEAPGNNSIGELMLRRAQGGSVAVWSPSGLSAHNNAMQLGEEFYKVFLDQGCGTLGVAVMRARQALVSFGAAVETLATYNLLGDPAMKLGGAPSRESAENGYALWRWQNFSPAELANPSVSGASGLGNAAGVENLMVYALGGGRGSTDLPIGLQLVGVDAEGNLLVDWVRRSPVEDVEYVLIFSDNMKQWADNPPFLQHLSATPVPASVIEQVRTRVDQPGTTNVFIGVKYIQK